MMSKITADHLARSAYVYVRQSTPEQVHRNHESRRRQYGLEDRARQLGWGNVVVIDDDLAISGGGVKRPGFERLLVAICEGHVGAVLTIEASRLARNGRDWHTLLEFCGLLNCLILDEDGVYDSRLPNDRLLLGMKGTMSEMELSIFRQRVSEARNFKSKRGELFGTIAVGYRKIVHEDRIEKEPDQRVQQAITLVFKKFAEFQSARQVHRWLRQEGIALPSTAYGPQGRHVVWKLPSYHSVFGMVTNPIYAGAYAYGRSTNRVRLEGGRKRVLRGQRQAREDWSVLLVDRHEGYISWSEYERNMRLIADNAGNKGLMVRRAVRRGAALLSGILRCGHCGRKLQVGYTKGTHRYFCIGASRTHGAAYCISFGATRADQAVSAEVLQLLQPLGVEASLKAIEAHDAEAGDGRRQVELALKQARYESNRAQRQYDSVDPENRIVAAELERRWNERLLVVREVETKLEQVKARQRPSLSEVERAQLLMLGTDLERAWNHPAATAEARKRILRTVVVEIIARIDGDQIDLMIHWQGGDHTQLKVRKARNGETRWTLNEKTADIIKELARQVPDLQIASILNRAGKRTGRDNTWTEVRIRAFRNDHGIARYRDGERAERGELNQLEAAAALGTCRMTILRLIRRGVLKGRQACKGAPWVIEAKAVASIKIGPRGRPVTASPDQKLLQF
jgi:DNA invertase Pin-like site-specific DNA recombinase